MTTVATRETARSAIRSYRVLVSGHISLLHNVLHVSIFSEHTVPNEVVLNSTFQQLLVLLDHSQMLPIASFGSLERCWCHSELVLARLSSIQCIISFLAHFLVCIWHHVVCDAQAINAQHFHLTNRRLSELIIVKLVWIDDNFKLQNPILTTFAFDLERAV